MKRHVALLRGINVGRAKRVAMADLRTLLGSLGYANVRTLLNSGNAVFDSASGSPKSHANRIHEALATELDVNAQVVVKSATEFASVASGNPHVDLATDPSRLLVVFTQQSSALSALADFAKTSWLPEALAVGQHAVYMWCPNGVIESKLAQAVRRNLGELGTARNWSTVEKLSLLLQDDSA
ncbi:DUF1697 domain-containing protein [Dokdonella soli]|uniref:DUF1697 domain-containing protein n=1 Tax=Dokdonella soli TaxID=529810 RepID=A0ABP3U9P0_9GAMM